MTTSQESDEPRLRADAQLNHDRLVAAAAKVFATEGEDASLKAIAESAGVGIGTLYRRFGTRESLVAAVNRSRIIDVCDFADTLIAAGREPDAALLAWMHNFVDFLVRRHGIAAAVIPVPSDIADFRIAIRDRLIDSIGRLMSAASQAEQIRDDISPADVLQLLGGAAYSATDAQQARVFVDLIADGLRLHAEPTGD